MVLTRNDGSPPLAAARANAHIFVRRSGLLPPRQLSEEDIPWRRRDFARASACRFRGAGALAGPAAFAPLLLPSRGSPGRSNIACGETKRISIASSMRLVWKP